jgi:nickel transport protein
MRWLTSCAVLAVAIATPVHAHQIESALTYLDGDLELKSNFSNGTPATGAVVRLLNPDGSAGDILGTTDASGQIRLDLSDVQDGRYDLQVDAGPGHRDYLDIPVTSGRVKLDDVVQSPLMFLLVGLLVSVRRRQSGSVR